MVLLRFPELQDFKDLQKVIIVLKYDFSLFFSISKVSSSLQDMLQQKTTKQPTLLALGSHQSIQQFFLKIEDFGIPLDQSTNIISAVDLLFKCHYVFNLEYAAPLVNFFLYLQTQIYNLKYKGKLPPRVTEVSLAIKAQ